MYRIDREIVVGETLAFDVDLKRLVDASTWTVRVS